MKQTRAWNVMVYIVIILFIVFMKPLVFDKGSMKKATNGNVVPFEKGSFWAFPSRMLCVLLLTSSVAMAAEGVIQLPRTGQTKCYETDGTEIFCEGTEQDGECRAGVEWPSPRFVDNDDGTVTDRLTGLMWIINEAGQMTWEGALDYVKTLKTGGHTDWRLPNVVELRSLIDYSQIDTALPQGHQFTKPVASSYWSSTTHAYNTYIAWSVYFSNGDVYCHDKTGSFYVRAVRGGPCGSFGNSVICLPRTGQTKCYDTAGSNSSCEGTGQDGECRAGVEWPSPRFVDNDDGTVTDRLTGLMWIINEAGQMTWEGALDYVKTLKTGGHTDWRLPNVEQLRSLIDYSQIDPSLPQGHPFTNAVASYYWSSTTYADDTSYAWGVHFYYGGVSYYGKPYGYYVRAVRGVPCGSFDPSTTTTTTTIVAGTTTTTTGEDTTTTTANTGICPVEQAVGSGNVDALTTIRKFRDMRMGLSATGMTLITLYYKHTEEITRIFLDRPALFDKSKKLIFDLLPVLTQCLTQDRHITLSEVQKGEIASLLKSISKESSPSLQKSISFILKQIETGELLKGLNGSR